VSHLADVATPHSLSSNVSEFYSAHNPEFVGDLPTVSWYSDGLRVFDVSDPARPVPAAGLSSRHGRGAPGQRSATGTIEVVVVGWLARPWRSNFWPLARPPT
jgi:hypothetical protein